MGVCSARRQIIKEYNVSNAIELLPNQFLLQNSTIRPDLLVDANGQKFAQFYIIEGQIPSAESDCKYHQVLHLLTNTKRVMKQVYKFKKIELGEYKTAENNEIEMLKLLDHPNIIRFYETYEDDDHQYIITEYFSAGMLKSSLKAQNIISEKQAAGIMKSILEGLVYIHDKMIMHRNIQPLNIQFENEENDAEVKLINFQESLKQELDSPRISTQYRGYLNYRAPEVIYRQEQTSKCDLWSCGVMQNQVIILVQYICQLIKCLIMIMSQLLMFSMNQLMKNPSSSFLNVNIIIEKIVIDKLPGHQVSNLAKKFLKKLLVIAPEIRFGAQEALAHPWILKNLNKIQLDKNIFEVLKQFNIQSKLEGLFLQVIVAQLISNEERQKLTQQFKAIDNNKDGTISKQELKYAYQTLYNDDEVQVNIKIDQMFDKIDFNLSGKINYSHFMIAASHREMLLSEDKIVKAFKILDRDGDGYISSRDLKYALPEVKLANQQFQDLINEFNRDRDRMISFNQFVQALRSPHQFSAPYITQTYSFHLFRDIGEIPQNIQPNILINQNGQVQENYNIKRILGKGAYADVFLLQHKFDDTFKAMKQIPKDRIINHREFDILNKINHPNIMKIYDVFEDPHYLYLIIEYFSGGELPEQIFNSNNQTILSKQQISSIIKQILEGLAYMHANKIIHRNLQPSHILFENSAQDAQIKLIGFGNAFEYQSDVDSPLDFVGPMLYTAPELATGPKRYDPKTDIWACGVMYKCLLYKINVTIIVTGPYSSPHLSPKEIHQEMDNLTQETLDIEIHRIYIFQSSDLAKQLLKRMLTIDPKSRIDAQEALSHPWITLTANHKSSMNTLT